MSKFQWTEEQAKAIELRNKNLLVSAAAGSGKTALLTERLKQLVLKDQIDVTKILVLTFTRAAAAEMKQRFKNNLYDSIYEKGWNLTEQEIIKQINSINDAQISTIDAFASNMVRRYFEAAEVDPGFRIADKSELNLVIEETIDEVFEDLFLAAEEGDHLGQQFLELIDLYGGSKSHEGLKKIIKEIHEFFNTLPYPEKWIEEATGFYDSDPNKILESEFFTSYVNSLKGDLHKAIANYKHLAAEFDNIPFSKKAVTKETLKREIETVLALENKEDFEKIVEGLKELQFVSKFALPKNMDPILKEELKSLRDAVIKDLKNYKNNFSEFNFDEELKKLRVMNEHFKTLIEVYYLINNRINLKKASARILSFADLEKAFLKILEDPKVRQDIQNEYDYIFLDEYQDTNGIQEAIINKIELGDNRFMVGDLRQAIYGFRNADPEIFLNKFDEYQLPDNNNELILLNQNFRSSPQVIDGINMIFEKIMSRKLGNINYDDSAKLIANRTDTTVKPEIFLVFEELLENEESDNKDVLQARFMAKKIRELINDPDEKISYSDIAILYRSINRRAQTVMEIFAEEGIPIIFDGDTQNVETQEITIFLKLLNLIDNHKQDLPLLTILHLPIFDFTLDDEVEIRKTYPEEPYFYQAVERYRDEQDNDLSQRLREFYDQLEGWRKASKHLELEDFLWELLLDSKYYDYIGGLSGGKERKQNLRLLLERAISYKDSSLKGLSSFLQYADRLQKRGQALSNSVNGIDTNDAVKLMSIHKSKGLEFPVVFLAGIQRQFHSSDAQDIILHKNNIYAPKNIRIDNNTLVKNQNIFNAALAERIKQEEYSEEMRLLYVALTRAMNRLITVGTIKRDENILAKWKDGTTPEVLFKKNSFLDWIMSAIYEDRLYDQSFNNFETDSWKISYVEQMPQSLEEAGIEDEDDLNSDYAKLKQQIFTQLNRQRKEKSKSIPIKMSVSRLKKHGIQKFDDVELNGLNEEKDTKASSAEIGTAVHKFLQHINIEAYIEAENKLDEIESQKNHLISKGLLSTELKEEIDNSLILNFFESDIGKRLINSYINNKQNVLKEMPFSMDLNTKELEGIEINEARNLQVSGIFDTCFIEDKGWILIDYKTDHFYSKQSVQKKLDEYSLQLNIYAKALEKLTQIPVKEKHIYFLSENVDYPV